MRLHHDPSQKLVIETLEEEEGKFGPKDFQNYTFYQI